ncbi:MAG: peptidylprolyl isomerase [Chloroflexi bacterium]|nr:peptidylprolyl isomerase [Chloroflexota bacterium]
MRRGSREEHRVAESALDAIDEFIAEQSIDRSNPRWRTQLNRPPQVRFDKESAYFWDLETNVGALSVRLMPDVAPMHVSSTIYLTRLGFYDGLSFHRVITQFMAQGGCPLGTGTGGPGYQYAGEFNGGVRHDRPGLLSMANAGPNTDGSQFFLTFVPTPWLDGNHTIFGEVVEGMETLQALEARGSQGGATSEPLEISSASIRVE